MTYPHCTTEIRREIVFQAEAVSPVLTPKEVSVAYTKEGEAGVESQLKAWRKGGIIDVHTWTNISL